MLRSGDTLPTTQHTLARYMAIGKGAAVRPGHSVGAVCPARAAAAVHTQVRRPQRGESVEAGCTRRTCSTLNAWSMHISACFVAASLAMCPYTQAAAIKNRTPSAWDAWWHARVHVRRATVSERAEGRGGRSATHVDNPSIDQCPLHSAQHLLSLRHAKPQHACRHAIADKRHARALALRAAAASGACVHVHSYPHAGDLEVGGGERARDDDEDEGDENLDAQAVPTTQIQRQNPRLHPSQRVVGLRVA